MTGPTIGIKTKDTIGMIIMDTANEKLEPVFVNNIRDKPNENIDDPNDPVAADKTARHIWDFDFLSVILSIT
jgi:hypothetical protein